MKQSKVANRHLYLPILFFLHSLKNRQLYQIRKTRTKINQSKIIKYLFIVLKSSTSIQMNKVETNRKLVNLVVTQVFRLFGYP